MGVSMAGRLEPTGPGLRSAAAFGPAELTEASGGSNDRDPFTRVSTRPDRAPGDSRSDEAMARMVPPTAHLRLSCESLRWAPAPGDQPSYSKPIFRSTRYSTIWLSSTIAVDFTTST